MVIRLEYNSYIAPHRQLDKSKSYIQLKGKMYLLFFNEFGELHEATLLGAWGKETSIVRFDASVWHTILPIRGATVYVESIQGPYKLNGTDFADWAPPVNDPNGCNWLEEQLRNIII
jgi:cupin fold WbuC family metalloprotein